MITKYEISTVWRKIENKWEAQYGVYKITKVNDKVKKIEKMGGTGDINYAQRLKKRFENLHVKSQIFG